MTLKKKSKLKVLIALISTLLCIILVGSPSKGSSRFITIPTSTYAQEQDINNGGITLKATPMKVKATAYANDPVTYLGTKTKVGYTLAVDPKVIPLGTKVYIPEFDKVFVAEDCGSAIKGKRIDIFMKTEAECKQWGIRDITVYILQD